ncbi:hypothetical protein CH06BL_26200 [Chromobacterium haemolyticum]|nr:hypothetical protein CH06BL_26200 [Chromobacterium haemolyticum]
MPVPARPPGKERKSHNRNLFCRDAIVGANAYWKVTTMIVLFMVSVLFLIRRVQELSLLSFIKLVVVLCLLCLLSYLVPK